MAKKLPAYSVKVLGKHKWVGRLKTYKHLKLLAATSLDWVIGLEDGKSTQKIHNKYYPHYDNYAFAQTILYLGEKHGMKIPEDHVRDLMGPFLPRP